MDFLLFFGQHLATIWAVEASPYGDMNPGGAIFLIRVLVYQLRKLFISKVRFHPLEKLFISAIFGLYISSSTKHMF